MGARGSGPPGDPAAWNPDRDFGSPLAWLAGKFSTPGQLSAVDSPHFFNAFHEARELLEPRPFFENDPGRRLEITWNHDQPPHPAMIFICRVEDNRACQWRTAQGIGIGTTLRELEKANGRPFEMVGWGSDVGPCPANSRTGCCPGAGWTGAGPCPGWTRTDCCPDGLRDADRRGRQGHRVQLPVLLPLGQVENHVSVLALEVSFRGDGLHIGVNETTSFILALGAFVVEMLLAARIVRLTVDSTERNLCD